MEPKTPEEDDKSKKYIDLFRKARSMVQSYESDFTLKHGRKPGRHDLEKAPEHVRTCIKNCKKIQAYFKQKGDLQKDLDSSRSNVINVSTIQLEKTNDPLEKDELTSSSIWSTTNLGSSVQAIPDPGSADMAPLTATKQSSTPVWGMHLNKTAEQKSGPIKRRKTETALYSAPSFSGLFSSTTQSNQQTRTSLKKRSRNGKTSFGNFFDTLGDTTIDNSSLPSPPSPDESKKFIDPLSRFDPEISMNSCENATDQATELEFVSYKPNVNISKPDDTGKRRALSILSEISSQGSLKPNRLSFSGLFLKPMGDQEQNSSEKDPDPCDDEPSVVRTAKRRRSATPDENKLSSISLSPKRIKSNDELNVPVNKSVDPSTSTIAATDVYSVGFEEDEVNVNSFKSARFVASKVPTKNPNENFVRINLKKKNYVRGKKSMTGPKYRRQEWKRKNLEKQKKETVEKQKKETVDKNKQPVPEDKKPSRKKTHVPEESLVLDEDSRAIEDDMKRILEANETEDTFLEKSAEITDSQKQGKFSDKVMPFFRPDSSDEEKGKVLHKALTKFGHVGFRPGQFESMKKILSGESTLVVSATGSGKSLIYQLPALLYAQRQRCITLVVSPLVSLMEDQVTGLPPFLNAACLHFNQTERQREKIIEEIKSGRLHFLLVSPETIAGGGSLFGKVLQNLPPIAFVCIDESHCVSQWSHNFRPAYLRLAKVVREKLCVSVILGLTATAPEATLEDVASRLGVCYATGIIRGPLLPENLTLSVSKTKNREVALVELLHSEPFSEFDSIIVYCTRREECDRISSLLRMSLNDKPQITKNGRTKMSVMAEAYHAGLTAFRRKTIQKQFMSGQLRIVVATVAFGMGIDKSDIRGIIHYNMPKTFENYVQEIGRAGRDGKPAQCHLFMDAESGNLILNELRRYIYSNSVDRHTVRKLVDLIFDKNSNSQGVVSSDAVVYKEVALGVEDLVRLLDMPEENISTLLCYLESHPKEWIKVLNPVYAKCTLKCYNGVGILQNLATSNRIVEEIIKSCGVKSSELEFNVVDLAARNNWESSVIKRELKNLQWQSNPASGRFEKSNILVEFHDLAFHFMAVKNIDSDCLEEVLDYLYRKILTREKSELSSLQRAYRAFNLAASPKDAENSILVEKSNKLKEFVREYFKESGHSLDEKDPVSAISVLPIDEQTENTLRGDVRQFVLTHTDHVWTGRAVARIFHGIPSPNFPAVQWGKVRRFWRSHLDVEFNIVCRLATQEVLKLRSQTR